MMAMHVEDLGTWCADVQALVDSGEFPAVRAQAPRLEHWGMRVMYLWDPSGVLWHITGRPTTA